MKYTVTARDLRERSNLEPYYVITLEGGFSKPVGNISVEELTLVRSEEEGRTFTVGSPVYLSSPEEDERP